MSVVLSQSFRPEGWGSGSFVGRSLSGVASRSGIRKSRTNSFRPFGRHDHDKGGVAGLSPTPHSGQLPVQSGVEDVVEQGL